MKGLDERMVQALGGEQTARDVMTRYARRTGLDPDGQQRRYLWTDAFAVCNYLSLLRRTGDRYFAALARRLVDQVHRVLGRHRPDDPRRGWISGLEEDEGRRHPTAGGLRIGKPFAERSVGEPMDAQAEWDRDGQYYHYLVRWIHALSRSADVLQDSDLHRWAVELAVAAQRSFTSAPAPGRPPRVRWKMSVDLSRALVSSQGAHDPLGGLVTACALRASPVHGAGSPPELERATHALASMCRPEDWPTADPLGVGGLLCDLWWSVQLLMSGSPDRALLEGLVPPLATACLTSLRHVSTATGHSLAFRELGLVVGLRAAAALVHATPGLPPALSIPDIHALRRYAPAADFILSSWLEPETWETDPWRAHEDINDVMLATALVPDEHLRA